MRQATLGLLLLAFTTQVAAEEYENPPIEYSKTAPENRISELQRQLDAGTQQLRYDEQFGYLPDLLKQLDIPVDSQMLVFSKTSLQVRRISPYTPRAIYFSDDLYVGYCHSGDVLEISAVDPKLGTAFYTLDQTETEKPHFTRQTDNCLICHGGGQTDGVPGHIVRSLFVDARGQPMLGEGSVRVNHTTPVEERWGGWYVSGTHGEQLHLGNLIVRDGKLKRPVTNDQGRNVTDLARFFSTENYLSPHSDIVALMVLEHQVLVHNLLTNASMATRNALHYEQEINQALGEPMDHRLPSTDSRIRNAGEKLLKGLLFVDEAKLTAPMAGTSSFAQTFAARGPVDPEGRSLRDLDLQTRLFKYPCSYLIYSPAFDALPEELKQYVTKRLRSILAGESSDEKYSHLTASDRQAIESILRATKPELFTEQ